MAPAAERDGSPSRRALVLRELRTADKPLGVTEVAHRLGVHPNTVRFHLDGLVSDGTVLRTLAEPDGPGRPRAVYSPRPGMDRSGSRNYLFLSRILLSSLATDDHPNAAEDALDAGRAWGHHLVPSPVPFQRPPTADEAVGRLTTLLADLDFSPEPATDGEQDKTLRLHHCPFLELAEEFGSVVCPVHLGLMQGALEEMNAPIMASGLEPFAESDACLVHLSRMPALANRSPAPKTPVPVTVATAATVATGSKGAATKPGAGKPAHRHHSN